MTKPIYRESLLNQLSEIIENHGANDKEYDNLTKALDILDVLEVLLAYTIYNTNVSADTIRDSAEESYFNIKRRALAHFRNDQEAERSKQRSSVGARPASSGGAQGRSAPSLAGTSSNGGAQLDRSNFESKIANRT